jgi:metallo-beta-lactamase family protein
VDATLRFLGGAGTVTGSKFLVETQSSRVLVDCGMFQGRKNLREMNWAGLPVDPASIDSVVLTHAHLDHVGYLPVLVAGGFHGKIYATHKTARLAQIVLADSGRLQEEEAEYANRKGYSKHHPAEPLYTEEQALFAAGRITGVRSGKDLRVAAGVEATWRSAGHILGSSTITLTLERAGRSILFSGDLGREHHPLLLPPHAPGAPDIVVCESTYGDRVHDDESVSLQTLAETVSRTITRGGVLVIPAFAVDRTEVVLYWLGKLMKENAIPRTTVYVDSPMSLSVLSVYRQALAERDPELRVEELSANPFEIPGGLIEARSVEASRALNHVDSGIIVASSGMATGGRVLHHLARRLPDARNTILLVGYQSPGTRGQLLAAGVPSLKMLGQQIRVRAQISEIGGFSVHADSNELISWLGSAEHAPEMTFFVHGEPAAAAGLGHSVHNRLGYPTSVPQLFDNVALAAPTGTLA